MKLFSILVACLLPFFTSGLHLGSLLSGLTTGLNGTTNGLTNGLHNVTTGLTNTLNALIPSLLHAISVDLLLDVSTLLEILNRPFDVQHTITDCAAHVNVSGLQTRNGLSSTSSRWYDAGDGTWFVPVVLDPRFTKDEKNVILAGMINIQDNSCMKIYIYDKESDLSGFDYVKIVRGSGQGCYSDSIGRARKGRQIVNLQPMEPSGCIVAGIAAHELLHAIGFDHQQCTPGRDQYVTILWNNIQSGAANNFAEDSASRFTNFGAPYDYGSVMHYGAYAFSNNGQKTIVVKQTAPEIGQRRGLSKWDGYKLNKMHGCPA